MKNFHNISYAQLSADIAASNLKTHTYVAKFFKDDLAKFDLKTQMNFSRKLKDLKVYRENSDYDDIEITITKSTSAIEIAKEVNAIIKQIYHV